MQSIVKMTEAASVEHLVLVHFRGFQGRRCAELCSFWRQNRILETTNTTVVFIRQRKEDTVNGFIC